MIGAMITRLIPARPTLPPGHSSPLPRSAGLQPALATASNVDPAESKPIKPGFQIPFCLLVWLVSIGPAVFCPERCSGQSGTDLTAGPLQASMAATETNGLKSYVLTSNAPLRDNQPPDHRVAFSELPGQPHLRTGNAMFDGLFALAVSEAKQNSVPQIKDWAYGKNEPLSLEAFQTGEFWTYVWTRDLAYSANLALAGFDPPRTAASLWFKTSALKPSVTGGVARQIIQDTGSGGSYPVSSDRIVWILGADATLNFLPDAEQHDFLGQMYPLLRDTLEEDRKVIFDAADGLYRGEQSFLDWREQTYPAWTKDNVVAIAMSKTLSVNAAHYFALRCAADYAGRLGSGGDARRYATQAAELKSAINTNFYDAAAGLYSTYLLTDGGPPVRAQRYDLLGESLAILLGVADSAQAKTILQRYPAGPFGPPVVWPEERSVPVYHNHAIWPFVTAYWIKAARAAGDAAVVDAGIRSLIRGAAFNLSNMENFDFATGLAEVKNRSLNGPVINSRRQLWSVAGYLAMVRDIVFGMETTAAGVRFLPFVTSTLQHETFVGHDTLELQSLNYRGKILNLRVHLPPPGQTSAGVCTIGKMQLNGKIIGREFVPTASLAGQNDWEIFLENPPVQPPAQPMNFIAANAIGQECFAPAQPQWANIGDGGISAEHGLLVLHFRETPGSQITFNVHRDGRLCATNIAGSEWTDSGSADYTNTVHFYVAEAVDQTTGNASHLSSSRGFLAPENSWQIPAADMENRGGELAEGRYFMDWGRPDHELLVKNFTTSATGHYLLRAEFSNGAGPVNTGITCAVKKLEVRRTDSNEIVAGGYLVMPQSGDWRRFDWSSVVPADLQAGATYSLRIFEDEYARNMSYLAQNSRYTAGKGGGDAPYNYVNIASLRLLRVGP